MKKIFYLLTFTSILISCQKENNDVVLEDNDDSSMVSYDLPWSTEFIHYENTNQCSGSHDYGYKLYYKDSLIKEVCISYGAETIQDSVLVNDTILHLLMTNSNYGSFVQTTINGGYTWSETTTGPPSFLNFHFVNHELSYCITDNQNNLYFTGIGESNLSLYEDSLTKGTHYILDLGTKITDIDSTKITLNDSVDFVIKFKE